MPDEQSIPAELIAVPEVAQPMPSAQPSETLPHEEHAAMIDIHDAHHAASTWREFFIHIATIVLGLIIAVGLEQGVEYVHESYKLRETRQLLKDEREEAHRSFAQWAIYWRSNAAVLKNNLVILEYLKQHPGTPEEKLPGVLTWQIYASPLNKTAWNSAQQNGVIASMPRKEAQGDVTFYGELQNVREEMDIFHQNVDEAHRYDLIDRDPSHLSPVQVDQVIERTQIALGSLADTGRDMLKVYSVWPEFPRLLTAEEVDGLHHPADPQTKETLAAAQAITDQRLKADGFVRLQLTHQGWRPIEAPAGNK
jgi:hypothetical protein